MGKWRVSLVVIPGAVAWSSAAVPATAPADRSPDIPRLIEELGSADPAVRAAAIDQAAQLSDVQRTAMAARIRLGEASAEAVLARSLIQPGVQPTLVSLRFDAGKPSDIFQELSRQSGFKIEPAYRRQWDAVTSAQVPITITRQPFWRAMQEVCAASGLTVSEVLGPEPRILLEQACDRDADIMQRPAAVSGAFLVLVRSLNRTSTAELGNGTVTRLVNVGLGVCVEPRVVVLRPPTEVELERAEDEFGNSMLLAPPGKRRMDHFMMPPAFAWRLGVNLQQPDEKATRIARLQGQVRCLVQAEGQVVEKPFDTQAADVVIREDNPKVILKALRAYGDGYRAELFIRRNDGSATLDDYHRCAQMKIVTDRDAEWRSSGMSLTQLDRGSCQFSVTFSAAAFSRRPEGEPKTVKFEITSLATDMTIPFEFKNLPLP